MLPSLPLWFGFMAARRYSRIALVVDIEWAPLSTENGHSLARMSDAVAESMRVVLQEHAEVESVEVTPSVWMDSPVQS